VTDGITLLLAGFMLALSAASLPVQLGRDWIWMHAARTVVSTLPLLVALAGVYFDSRRDLWLAGACGIAAVLAIAGALILLPRTENRAAMALLTAAGVVRLAGRRPGRRRIDGGRTSRGAVGYRADRPARCDGCGAADLVRAIG